VVVLRPAMVEEKDEETADAVMKLGERMKPVIESLLPEDEAGRAGTDQCLSRWVRANDLDVDAASKALMKYVNWYIEKPQYGVPEGVVSVAQGKGVDLVEKELATKKAFLIPEVKDAEGRPVILIQVRRHDPAAEGYDIDQLTLFAVQLIESAIAAMEAPVDTLCCVFDLREIGMANVDMKAVKRIMFLLQHMYPERLGRCWLLDAPTLFTACWAIISPMMKASTTRKIQFVSLANLTETFGEDSEVIKIVTENAAENGESQSEAPVIENAPEANAETDIADKPAEGYAAEKQPEANGAENEAVAAA